MTEPEDRAKAISDALRAPFDTSLIETKQGKSYIGHEHIRARVMDATGNQFDWLVTSEEFRTDGAVSRTDRSSGEVFQPPVHRVSGVLTIPGLGSRHGTGVQVIERGANEDTYKAAESDAFKRAAMAFGVALQLYMSTSPQQASQRPQRAPQQRQATNGTASAAVALSDEAFAGQVRDAAKQNDGAAYRHLAAEAGKNAHRWQLLITSTVTEAALDWVLRQMENKGVTDPNVLMEADAHRGLIREGALAHA